MPTWKRALRTVAADAEDRFDRLRLEMKERLGRLGPVQIQPYLGIGTPDRVHVQGRVLEDKGIEAAQDNDSVWRNLLAMYRRFESDEIPGARLRVTFGGASREVVTDGEGYFHTTLAPARPLDVDAIWHPFEVELLESVARVDAPVRARGRVLIPSREADFAVVSDVDDTVIRTRATSLLHMARLTFLGNARTRLPFRGVAAFYRALQHGTAGDAVNPLFYVSSSPWNLYDLLVEFFRLQEIPLGPLFLRDLGLDRDRFVQGSHRRHKLAQIERLLELYPDLPFVLVGDSGQKDPEIYAEVVRRYPGRVSAVFIRDVTRSSRDRAVEALADEVARRGVPMHRVEDTLEAAHAAVEMGLLPESALDAIRADRDRDARAPSETERLLGLDERNADND